MKIVVTNDDGYDQPGLAALVRAARPLGDVIVVAPATAQSNVGHRVTMRDPICVDQPADDIFVVHGTPADCSRLTVKALVPDVDWVLAGINPGANLGSDVYQSGTVAAAREAAILGVPSLAISQYIAAGWIIDWPAVEQQAVPCLAEILARKLEPGRFWNINLPSPIPADTALEQRNCHRDTHPHHYRYTSESDGYQYRGVIHDRPRSTGSDVDVCFGGAIAITCLEI